MLGLSDAVLFDMMLFILKHGTNEFNVFDVSLSLVFLSVRDCNVLLVMYAFTVSESHDLFSILVFRLSLKLKFSSETPMRFPLSGLQNF